MRKKKAILVKKNLCNRLEVIGIFKSGCTVKFKPLKNKQKLKPLKANKLKFLFLKSKFAYF